jgi:predicted cupin superfamily sugar epimerase
VQARTLIERLGLAPHPEGGWYVETFRGPRGAGRRETVSAIYFLLEAGQRSQWHKVDATELWLWHAGDPLRLDISDDRHHSVLLGPDLAHGQVLQAVVPAGAWQTAVSEGCWTLVSCVVAPAFRFAGFELAPAGWSPGAGSAGASA